MKLLGLIGVLILASNVFAFQAGQTGSIGKRAATIFESQALEKVSDNCRAYAANILALKIDRETQYQNLRAIDAQLDSGALPTERLVLSQASARAELSETDWSIHRIIFSERHRCYEELSEFKWAIR